MKKLTLLIAFFAAIANTYGQYTVSRLDGKIIGSTYSVDYSTGESSTTVNTKEDAFDGDYNTFFASYDSSFTWIGLEFDEPHVITAVGYVARNTADGMDLMQLGVFEGANKEDFSDAIPIHMITEPGNVGKFITADINCSKGFKYVRYVGPHDARCNIAELAFYGYASQGDDYMFYQPTNLPLVVVNTPGMEWFNDDDKEHAMEGSHVYVIDKGKFNIDAGAQIRGRGHASWTFPKKPFRIKFDDKQKVLGGPATAKKWVMVNNYGDKTLMRNMIAFEISRLMGMDYTPSCHPVDLIFNGEYQGTYQLCDQIEVGPDRINITKMGPDDIAGEALTGGYLIEIDAHAAEESPDKWFNSTGGHLIPVNIKSPDPVAPQQYEYMRTTFTNLERSVYNIDPADEVYGYRNLLDEESFLRYLIVNELAGNTDAFWSVYMTLERGDGKFRTGPVWDFDLGFDNDRRTYSVNDKTDLLVCSGYASFAGASLWKFVWNIVKNDVSAKHMQYLWSDARTNNQLTYEHLDEKITEYYNMMLKSQALNFRRWPIMDKSIHLNPKVWGSYEAEVQHVRDYLAQRFDKLDELIGLVEIDGINDIDSPVIDVKAVGKQIVINSAGAYHIYNMQGIEVAAGTGNASVSVSSGIYIVHAGQSAVKVIVTE